MYRRIVQAKLFIDENYSGKIALYNIAREAYFSKFHFIRLFKEAFGRTPHQYVSFVRIEKAKELLRSGKSVTDVCFTVGFDSLSSFSGLFKRNVGIAPSSFQKMQTYIKSEIRKEPLRFVPHCFASANRRIENRNFEEANV